MELAYKDDRVRERCRGKKPRIVALVHQHLGLASVADVRAESEDVLVLETHAGSIRVDSDLSRVFPAQ